MYRTLMLAAKHKIVLPESTHHVMLICAALLMFSLSETVWYQRIYGAILRKVKSIGLSKVCQVLLGQNEPF